MAREIIALQDYSNLSDAAFGAFGIRIGTMMEKNVKFPAPPLPPKELLEASIAFVVSIPGKNAASRMTATPKNAQREVIFENLEKMRKYVNYVASGNEETLLSSGFNISESVPVNFTKAVIKNLTQGRESGTLELTVYAQNGAKLYEVQVVDLETEGAEPRTLSFPRATKMLVTDCVPGKKYQIQVRIIGAEGIEPSAWSVPMTIMSL